MRRTRGERGRLRFLALAARVCPAPAFLPVALPVAAWPDLAADFDGADFRAAGGFAAGCSAAGFCAAPDWPAVAGFSEAFGELGEAADVEEAEVEEAEDC
jgi:hypothetical protein